jgi:hypothetical protein
MKRCIKRLRCQICGIEIPPGGIFYIGRTEIISGSDGILPDTKEPGDRIIAKALEEITKAKSEKELMEGVYQEIKLLLCGRCRLLFRERILDLIKY